MNKNFNSLNKLALIKEFILSTENFWEINYKVIDEKHSQIINKFKEKYKDNLDLYLKDLINWEGQTNLGAPFQFSFQNIKYQNFSQMFKNLLKFLFQNKLKNYFDKVSFFDDIEIIKNNGGINILKDMPVHKLIDTKDLYFIDNEVSSNNRWNRYIYLASQFKKHNLINSENFNWLDIGSYYGGLQIILKKYYKNSNFYLLDFNHQLCRSYVCLKSIYPDSKHILPDNISSQQGDIKNAFFYVPVDKFYKLDKINFDLVSNFFSFGEMTREGLESYLKSKIILNAKKLYLVNRFISSPFFERTYKNDLNIFDYNFNNFDLTYFDIFPIHHYKNIKRRVLGKDAFRPISSPYFEKIMIRK